MSEDLTPEQVALLKEMWPKRKISLERVALAIGNGITAANLHKRAQTLGLGPRHKGNKGGHNDGGGLQQRIRINADRAGEEEPKKVPGLKELRAEGGGISFAEVTGCRWPVSGGAPASEMLFCNNPTADKRPYCAGHCRVGFDTRPVRTQNISMQERLRRQRQFRINMSRNGGAKR